MKMFNINGWHYLTMQNVNIFVRDGYKKAFIQFWNKVMYDLDDNLVVGVLLKIQSSDGAVRTLGSLQKVTKGDRSELSKTLRYYINEKGNDYTTMDIDKVIFQYIILGNKNVVSTEISNPISKSVSSHIFGSFSFPLSTDLLYWGKVVDRKGDIVLLENDNYEDVLIEVSFHSDRQILNYLNYVKSYIS
jgi:hypothetical protein